MTHIRRPHARWRSRLKYRQEQRLWKMVEGAVADACKAHPDYLTERGRQLMVGSVTKRVVGTLRSASADGRF